MAQVTYTIEDGTCFVDFDNRKKTVWKERWVNPSELSGGVVKGSILTMNIDGQNKDYRVIKLIDDNVVEVVAMYNLAEKIKYGSSQNYTGNNIVIKQTLDAYYDTFSDDVKAAIVTKNFKQDFWKTDNTGSPKYSGYYGTTKPGTIAYTISFSRNYNNISANVYPLSVQDVLDYILDTNITDGALQNYNIWKMFWNDEVSHADEHFWLISGLMSSTQREYYIVSATGSFSTIDGSMSDTAYWRYPRPAFKIDLSKINYTIKE